jgi:zinc and cadmium transporter
MNLPEYLILFSSVFLSGLSFLLFKKNNPRVLRLTLAFTGAFLFSISVLHLIPEIYQGGDKNIGLFILIGFFIQVILEFFSEGIEHGHIHVHKKHVHSFPVAVMGGLCIHSFLEGMPLTEKFMQADSNGRTLLIGIILHHLPVAFALMSMLMDSGLKKSAAVAWLLVFALMAPVGALASHFIGGGHIENAGAFFDRTMAIVIGIFLHISTTILFESGSDHRFNRLKLFTIVCGAGVAFMLS